MRYMLISKVFATISGMLCLFSSPTEAKLALTELSALLCESDVIMRARVIQSAYAEKEFSGFAVLEVKKTYKGVYPHKSIKITWGSEVHDQKIATIGRQRVLFLKEREDGTYTGTHYGRSYWPLYMDPETRKRGPFIPYVYPTNKVEINFPGLVEEVNLRLPFEYSFSESSYPLKVIFLNNLVEKLDDIIETHTLKIEERERKAALYNRLFKGRKQVLYPECPDYMEHFTTTAVGRKKEVCSGSKDRAYPIQNGWEASWSLAGRLINIIHYKTGEKHGPIKVWFKDGGRWTGNHLEGKLHGRRQYWHANGQQWQEATYLHGGLHGKVTSWYENGKLESEAYFEKGLLIKRLSWDEEGNPKTEDNEPFIEDVIK